MSPGIAHAVLYAVMGEIGAVRCGGKGKFQNPHPRQTGIRQQLRHVGRRLTQIFCDEADTVELLNGERMPWEQVKRDGIDYIALYYVNEKGKPVQILDAELA